MEAVSSVWNQAPHLVAAAVFGALVALTLFRVADKYEAWAWYESWQRRHPWAPGAGGVCHLCVAFWLNEPAAWAFAYAGHPVALLYPFGAAGLAVLLYYQSHR